MNTEKETIKCVLHGSFRKHFDLLQEVHKTFTAAGIEVLAPRLADVVSSKDGFFLYT